MLSNLRELIPGADLWPHFVRNASNQFEARSSQVQIESSNAILLQGMEGSAIPVAVAHGEGRAEFSSPEQIDQLRSNQQIAISFAQNGGGQTDRYPFNPNGSPQGLTGITNDTGRVLIMMPHPERVYRTIQNSWPLKQDSDRGPWLRLFENARRHFS